MTGDTHETLDGAEALWTFAHSVRPQLLATALLVTSNRADADDAVSAAVLKAPRCPYHEPRRVLGYLRHATRNAVIDQYRRARLPDSLARLAATERTIAVDPAVIVCDQAEDRWLCARAAKVLPESTFGALRMVGDGHRIADVAAEYGKTPKAVQSRVERARRRVQREAKRDR